MKPKQLEIFSIVEDLKEGNIDPNDLLIESIMKTKDNFYNVTEKVNKEDLIPIALALRYGADPNLYLQLNEIGNIHLLGYVYYNLSKPILFSKTGCSNNFKDNLFSLDDQINQNNLLLNSIILMLKLAGSDPSSPAFSSECSISSSSSFFEEQRVSKEKEKVKCSAMITKDFTAIKCDGKRKVKEKTKEKTLTENLKTKKCEKSGKSIFSWVCESGYSNILMEKEENVKPETLSLAKAYLDKLNFSSSFSSEENKNLNRVKDLIYAHSEKSLLNLTENLPLSPSLNTEFEENSHKYLSYSIDSLNLPAFKLLVDEGVPLKYYHVTQIIFYLSTFLETQNPFEKQEKEEIEYKVEESISLLQYISPLSLEEKEEKDLTFESLKYKDDEEKIIEEIKEKIESKEQKVLRKMLEYAIERGSEMDLYQLNMLEKYDEEFAAKIQEKYEKPYWRKYLKVRKGKLNDRMKLLAYNLNLNLDNTNTKNIKDKLFEEISKLAQADLKELKKGYIRRQEQRISSTLNSPLAFIGDCNPKAVLRNKSLIENLYEHVDNDIVFYKDGKDIGWAFTRDQFAEILEKKLNPYTQERLPILLTDEMEKRLAFFNSIFDFVEKEKVVPISETLLLLHSDDEISNEKTDKKMVLDYNRNSLRNTENIEDMIASFRDIGIEFDLRGFYNSVKDESYLRILYIMSTN